MAFSQQPRYDRAASSFLDEYLNGLDEDEVDEQRMMLLWDSFVLEHKLPNGRTVVEQFVAARPQLSDPSGRCCSAGATWCRARSRCSGRMGPRSWWRAWSTS